LPRFSIELRRTIEVGAETVMARPTVSEQFALRRLDLDHLGPEIGEQGSRGGCGDERRDFDDPDAGEGCGHDRSPSKLARRKESCGGCDIMTPKTRTRPAPGEHEATDSARGSVRVAVLQRMSGTPAVLISNVDELLNRR